MSDLFSLIDEEVDASKFDKVKDEKGSNLSNLIRQSMKIEQEIADELGIQVQLLSEDQGSSGPARSRSPYRPDRASAHARPARY